MKFCQCLEGQQNKELGFSCHPLILVRPNIPIFFPLSYPFRNDHDPVLSLPSSSRKNRKCNLPKVIPIISQGDCIRPNNQAYLDAFFPISLCLSETFL